MPDKLVIRTGARLHFGILSHGRSGEREFGGAGVMLSSPGYHIAFEAGDADSVVAAAGCRQRIEGFVRAYRAAAFEATRRVPCCIEVRQSVPSHIGLGSGTQLGMAVARGLSLFDDDASKDVRELARRVGRGGRSGLGVHGFARGGLLVEAGKAPGDTVAPLVARCVFPESWRFVLVTPPEATGPFGVEERDAFARLPPMPQSTTDRLCGILVRQLLPAVREVDIDECGEALYEYGRIVGEYFQTVQGDVYASPSMVRLVAHLRDTGIRGCGQSSWGPTLFVLTAGGAQAEELSARLSADARWSECRIHIAAPMNTGAIVAAE